MSRAVGQGSCRPSHDVLANRHGFGGRQAVAAGEVPQQNACGPGQTFSGVRFGLARVGTLPAWA
jgi:hypothetical protein